MSRRKAERRHGDQAKKTEIDGRRLETPGAFAGSVNGAERFERTQLQPSICGNKPASPTATRRANDFGTRPNGLCRSRGWSWMRKRSSRRSPCWPTVLQGPSPPADPNEVPAYGLSINVFGRARRRSSLTSLQPHLDPKTAVSGSELQRRYNLPPP